MAVITFERDNNRVSVLVEKTDVICDKEGNTTYVNNAKTYNSGKIFVNGEIELCMIRGERE